MTGRTEPKTQPLSPEQVAFRQFILGGITLLASLGCIVWMELAVAASAQRETATAIALFCATIGGIIAISGYLSLLVARIKTFLNKP